MCTARQYYSVREDMTMAWQDIRPTFKAEWEKRFGRSGGRWEEYEPRYRYGWELAETSRYAGRQWTEIEPDVRRAWENRYPDQPWDRVSGSIRDAWDSFATTGQSVGRPFRSEGVQTIQLREEELMARKE